MNRGGYTICVLLGGQCVVIGDTLAAFIDNYTESMNLWCWSPQATSDTEMKARLQGVEAVI